MCARSRHSPCAAFSPKDSRHASKRSAVARPSGELRKPRKVARNRPKATGNSPTEETVEEPMRLQIGDKVVFPPHGVVEVVAVERQEIEGVRDEFYHLESAKNRLHVMIPAQRADRPCLRPIAEANEIREAFRVLKLRKKTINEPTWSKRQKACLARLRTGSVLAVAEVLRDLYLTKRDKELSVAEKRLLETAHDLFVAEAALATRRPESEVDAQVRVIFRL